MHKKKRRISGLTGKLLVLLLLSCMVFGATVWGATARYVHRSGGEGIVKAKEFYFTSDYLTPEGKTYTLNPGTTEVIFKLRNYDGLKVSELEINYTVTGIGEQPVTGTIPADTETEVPITLNNLEPGRDYTVTVTGENGYMKMLRATFTVKEPVEGIYKHTENYGDYVILTVWTQGKAGTATVTVPDGLIPDYTDAKLYNKSAGDTITVSLNKEESLSYRFFTTGSYNKKPIPVTVDGAALEETALS